MATRRFSLCSGITSVPQDRDPIGDPVYLAHAVSDVHDATAAVLEIANHGKQLLNFRSVKSAGGFVHDHHARFLSQGFRDFDHLAGGKRIVLHFPLKIEVEPELGQTGRGTLHFQSSIPPESPP